MDVNYWLASKIIYSYSNILFDAEVFDHSQLKQSNIQCKATRFQYVLFIVFCKKKNIVNSPL